MEAEATGFVRTCDATAPIQAEFKVYMRYTGQGWEIPISLTAEQARNPDAATFSKRLFEADYTTLFGRTVEGMDVEITVWSVNATTPPASTDPVAAAPKAEAVKTASTRPVFDPALGQVVRRFRHRPRHDHTGPDRRRPRADHRG